MRYTRLSLGLEPAVIERIDALRGDVPRERYLRRMVDTGLARAEEIRAADRFAEAPTVAEKVNKAMEPMRRAAAQISRPRTHIHEEEQPVATVIPESCSHPKSAEKKFGWGVLCGLCQTRLR